MTDSGELITGAEQVVLIEGDGAIRRSEAVTGMMGLAQELGFSDEITAEVVERFRNKLDTMDEGDVRKITKAIGKVSGLLTVEPVATDPVTSVEEPIGIEDGPVAVETAYVTEDVLPVEPEAVTVSDDVPVTDSGTGDNAADTADRSDEPHPADENTVEAPAAESEPLPLRTVLTQRFAEVIPPVREYERYHALHDYLDPQAVTTPENEAVRADTVGALRSWISERGPLEKTRDDYAPGELFNLRVLLGWFKNAQGEKFVPGKSLHDMMYVKGNGPAKRREIEASVTSALQKLAESPQL